MTDIKEMNMEELVYNLIRISCNAEVPPIGSIGEMVMGSDTVGELLSRLEAGQKAIAAMEQIGDLVYNNSCHADTSNAVTRIFMAYSKKLTPK